VVNPPVGTVLGRDGGVYRVVTETGEVRAVLRGKMKRDTPHIVVGDLVRLEPEPGGELHGIVAVEPRTTLLERRVPEGRGNRPIAANIDQVLVVTAAARPDPIPQLIDRLLIVAEANSIAAGIIINKVDLQPNSDLARRFRAVGYPVYETSAKTGEGIESLKAILMGRTSVVTGPSGAGKSSLLNTVQPGLRLRIGDVSEKIQRGRHTTVSALMIPLDIGGFIVDTPGFSEVGLWGVPPRELASCFPDLRSLIDGCRFADCLHCTEPGCAVRAAAGRGEIAADRLESYLVVLDELRSAPQAWE
jgi:ribosome biogenesis GTPase / thiamine phosphate phosphatase